MAKISIFDLTDRAAVLEAMRRYDALGREEFLRVHQYGPARSYFVLHEGREYDSKAIAGVAYGIQHGVEVTPDQFSGGQETVARAFERLGFEVMRAEPWDPTSRTLVTRSAGAWDADEMILALHWYLRFPSETLDEEHPVVLALSRLLQRHATARDRHDVARVREPIEVAAQLAGYAVIDPVHGHGDAVQPSRAHVDAWARWAGDGYARKRKVEEILGRLDVVGTDQERSERLRRIEAVWGVVEAPPGYRAQTGRRGAAGPSLAPVALLSPHRGPRRVAPRTAAEPRVEDPEAHDRANEAHESVRGELVLFLEEHGFCVYDASEVARQQNVEFDLAADDGELRLVIEAKSMPADANADANRLRSGLGQVIWYRHRFLAVCGERRVAVLVIARQPRDHEDWLAACREVGVVLTWPERFVWLVDECRCAQDRG